MDNWFIQYSQEYSYNYEPLIDSRDSNNNDCIGNSFLQKSEQDCIEFQQDNL